MARALAIETSGRVGSIALVDEAGVGMEEQFEHGLQNAAKILPLIDRLVKSAGWSPPDLQEIYLSIGPGSFTGLRLGVTLSKTMALARGVKIVAVPTLRVLSENAPAEAQHLIIVLDAKRGQIFTARFEREQSQLWTEREPAHLDSLPAMLQRAPRPVHLLGEGLPYHHHSIPQNDSSVIITASESWNARASAVARIGHEMARRQQFADPFTLAPLYIRLPEAEEKRLRKTSD